MRIVVAALAALSLAACASVQPVPAARPLNSQQVAAIGPTSVVISENNTGVMKSWFRQDSSATAASQGLIGVLVGAALDGMMNYGPSRRARRDADQIAEIAAAEMLNDSLTEHFRRQIARGAPGEAVSVSDVRTVQKITSPEPIDGVLAVSTSYLLSEDASTLQVSVAVSYQDPSVPYATPYTFEGAPPKSELEGPVYRNTFTYNSDQLPVPVLTPDLRARLIASIEENARDENGALPVEGTDEFKSMTRELEQARDDRLTKSEISIFLAREWTRNNGALIRSEVEKAHAFIAKYAVIDMNRTVVHSLTGTDEIVETLNDGRTVRRIGAGVLAGSYSSLPGNVSDFVTFGNAAAMAEVNQTRIQNLQQEARTARATR